MSSTPRRIAIIGGGRWARTLFGVTERLLSPGDRIIWHARHGAADVREIVARRPNTVFEADVDEVWRHEPTAAVIATAAGAHAGPALAALERGIPVLVEKPMTANLEDARILVAAAERNNAPLGVNLEFAYASYLHAIARVAPADTIAELRIVWLDPVAEERYGEKKQADIGTHRCLDIYPHIWSILRVLSGQAKITVRSAAPVHDQPGALELSIAAGSTPATAALSRRAPGRARIVEITCHNGRLLRLDFSHEPGTLSIDGTPSEFESGWETSPRPLSAAIGGFLDVADNPAQAGGWQLAAQDCMGHLTGALDARWLAREAEAALVARDLAGRSDEPALEMSAILIDNLAPELADAGLVGEARRCGSDSEAAARLVAAGLTLLQGAPPDIVPDIRAVLERSPFLEAVRRLRRL
jgi:predicted dehydrogenase